MVEPMAFVTKPLTWTLFMQLRSKVEGSHSESSEQPSSKTTNGFLVLIRFELLVITLSVSLHNILYMLKRTITQLIYRRAALLLMTSQCCCGELASTDQMREYLSGPCIDK
uniref:Uncharacterized protein n=1 Tax=Physcomitrium patens TaxID=3218 RepID=A0A2K1IWQ0_PHYPA|nr:hypothetical protein PHYPA_023511 [Physcomitrium patens]